MATVGGIDIGEAKITEQVVGGIDIGDAKIDKTPLEFVSGIARGINVGLAQGAGGLVDFINPFDEQTGSAVEGIKAGFEAIAPGSTENIPEGLAGEFAVGTGEALAAFAPVVKGLQLLKGVGGAVGAFADDALKAMLSVGGVTAEAVAGGTARVSETAAREAGAGPVLSSLAGVAGGGLALPTALATGRGLKAVAAKTPGAGFVGRQARDLQRSFLPMTEGGAREVAATRLRGLAGGEERAGELAGLIDPDDPLSLTGAQQTGDPNLLGLERAAAREDPLIRERLMARGEAGREAATRAIQAEGGDVGEARTFFADRLRAFKASMDNTIDEAVQMGTEAVEGVAPRVSEAGASGRAVERIKGALDTELATERDLWNAVPKEAVVSTQGTRETLADIVASTPRAQQNDIPAIARRLLERTGDEVGPAQIQDADTVAELHGLYSELRRISRSALAGTDENKNLARISNQLADAILEDLGAVDPTSPVGRSINEARAFSRALHETFDQGDVGRILQRTISGDERIISEAALRKTVGRGGPEGQAAARRIEEAAPQAGEDIGEFLRGRFTDAVTAPDGKFTPASAQRFLRNNRELLADRPELSRELRRALSSRNAAASFAARNQARQKLVAAESAPARFAVGQDEKAILSIISAENPAKAATSIANAARKDPTGRALEGVKAAFTDHLVSGENINGRQVQALLKDKNMRAAMRKIFTTGELGRLNKIAASLAKMNPDDVTAVDSVIDASTNKLLEMVVRVAAAQKGGQLGGGSLGGSMQTANIFVERSRSILRNLTNVRARALLNEAIENPALFKDLLLTPKSITLPPATRSRLAPFLAGAAAGLEDRNQPQ